MMNCAFVKECLTISFMAINTNIQYRELPIDRCPAEDYHKLFVIQESKYQIKNVLPIQRIN